VPHKRKGHRSPVTPMDRALDEIYAEIPEIPNCDGSCAAACTTIAMQTGEWERIVRRVGHEPKGRPGANCPLLSPNGRCTVYTVRPYLCRIWGATPDLRCPRPECEPTRWLSKEEAHDIFERICAVAGQEAAGPLGKGIERVWEAINLEGRAERAAIIKRAQEQRNDL